MKKILSTLAGISILCESIVLPIQSGAYEFDKNLNYSIKQNMSVNKFYVSDSKEKGRPNSGSIVLELDNYIYFNELNQNSGTSENSYSLWVYNKSNDERKRVLPATGNLQNIGNKIFAACMNDSSDSESRCLYCFDIDGSNMKFITSGVDSSLILDKKPYSVYGDRLYVGISKDKYCSVISCNINGDDIRTEVEPFDELNHKFELYETYAIISGKVYTYTSGSGKTISVTINNKSIPFSDPPIIYNDSIMVPMKNIFEAMGLGVSWNDGTKTAIATQGNKTIKLTIGQDYIYKDDEKIKIETPPVIVNGSAYVPVRIIAESMDAEVVWNSDSRTVEIKTIIESTPAPKSTPLVLSTAVPVTTADPSVTAKPTQTPRATPTPKPTIIPALLKPTPSPKPADSILTLYVNSYVAYKNDVKQYIDEENYNVAPVIVDDRTLVPVRYISEAFDGKVDWDSKAKIVTITSGKDIIKIQMDKYYFTINGERIDTDVAAQVIEERTMLPLRAFAEAIGMYVDYYNGMIIIGKQENVNKFISADLDKYIHDKFEPYLIK